jgi:hypothetical protein
MSMDDFNSFVLGDASSKQAARRHVSYKDSNDDQPARKPKKQTRREDDDADDRMERAVKAAKKQLKHHRDDDDDGLYVRGNRNKKQGLGDAYYLDKFGLTKDQFLAERAGMGSNYVEIDGRKVAIKENRTGESTTVKAGVKFRNVETHSEYHYGRDSAGTGQWEGTDIGGRGNDGESNGYHWKGAINKSGNIVVERYKDVIGGGSALGSLSAPSAPGGCGCSGGPGGPGK